MTCTNDCKDCRIAELEAENAELLRHNTAMRVHLSEIVKSEATPGNQRIYCWGYCDACDDLHPCSDEREGPPEWDFYYIDDEIDHDTPVPVFIGVPAFFAGES